MKSKCKIDFNGNKHWYLNGKLHREDGPAGEYASGSKHWYLNDIYYSNPNYMPLNLFLAYVKWELNKNG